MTRCPLAIRNLFGLTPREQQIFDALMQGATTRQIAEAHGLGRQTVKNYLTVIYQKMGVSSRIELQQRTPSDIGPMNR